MQRASNTCCQSARRNQGRKMFSASLKVLFSLFLWTTVLTATHSTEVAENLTETDDAEFRQGGIAQQLMSSYPAMGMGMGSMYGGNTGGYQMMGGAGAGANGGSGYVNMLRNLYRPSSFGLTDKVKHWVKSFMNRRQYVKPYYNPSAGGLSYAPSEYGAKPMFGGVNGYKAISVPLRQLQKYYKPYYATSEGGSPQYMQSAGGSGPGSASASSFISYSPNGAGAGSSSGLYASESASAGHFAGSSGGMYGSSMDGASALYGASGPASSGLFSSGNSPSGGLFSSGSGPNSGLFSSPGGSSGIFSASDGSNSGLFSGGSPSSGGLYGSGGSPSSGLYHGSSGGGSNGPVFSLDGSSSGGLYGSDGGSQFYNANSGPGGYGSSASASSLLASLNGGSSGGSYGDLYASGANPSASLYNPGTGDNGRSYGQSNKQPSYGASSSALYVSSDERNSDSYPSSKSSKEHSNSFNSGSNQAEASYSVSFQPAQGKSFSAGFQPVSYSSDSGNSQGFQEKSS